MNKELIGPVTKFRSSLLILCGMPRSGTSLIGALLNSSPDIEVFNEISHLSRFSAFGELIHRYREWCSTMMSHKSELWREIMPATVEDGIEQLFRTFCRTLRPIIPPSKENERWDAGTKVSPQVSCIKSPHAEIDPSLYEEIFQNRKPKYIIDVKLSTEVEAFVNAWPEINRTKMHFGDTKFLPDDEKRLRIGDYIEQYKNKPELVTTIREMMG